MLLSINSLSSDPTVHLFYFKLYPHLLQDSSDPSLASMVTLFISDNPWILTPLLSHSTTDLLNPNHLVPTFEDNYIIAYYNRIALVDIS